MNECAKEIGSSVCLPLKIRRGRRTSIIVVKLSLSPSVSLISTNAKVGGRETERSEEAFKRNVCGEGRGGEG